MCFELFIEISKWFEAEHKVSLLEKGLREVTRDKFFCIFFYFGLFYGLSSPFFPSLSFGLQNKCFFFPSKGEECVSIQIREFTLYFRSGT